VYAVAIVFNIAPPCNPPFIQTILIGDCRIFCKKPAKTRISHIYVIVPPQTP